MLSYDITLTITAACISDICYTLSGVLARFNATIKCYGCKCKPWNNDQQLHNIFA